MAYSIIVLLVGLVGGFIAIASNPSPYFAAFGLVIVAGMGCGVILSYGGPFLALVLFLIYLGGMLVVFAYSAALAAEPYPESWGSREVSFNVGVFLWVIGVVSYIFLGNMYLANGAPADELTETSLPRGDTGGAGALYIWGGWLLTSAVWVLFMTLFVVLELTRGLVRGTLRAV